jgi:hypothetical protein
MGRPGRPPIGKRPMTPAERQRRRRAGLTAKPTSAYRDIEPVTKPTSPDNAKLAKELAQAKARIAELERQRMRIAELEGREERPQAGASAQDEITALRDENYAFRVELEARNHVFKNRAGGGLSKGQYAILLQCCHPDNSAGPKTRSDGFRLLKQIRYVLCNEAELPSMDEKKYSTWARQLWARRQQEIKEVKKYAKRRGQPKASPRSTRSLPR